MQTKTTTVRGQKVTLHSLDGTLWCMHEEDVWVAARRQQWINNTSLQLGPSQRKKLSALDTNEIWGEANYDMESYLLGYVDRDSSGEV